MLVKSNKNAKKTILDLYFLWQIRVKIFVFIVVFCNICYYSFVGIVRFYFLIRCVNANVFCKNGDTLLIVSLTRERSLFTMPVEILEQTHRDLSALLQANSVVLVDFFAAWCGPCKMLAPVMDQVAQKYHGKLKVLKVDIDTHPELADDFRVKSVPTIMIFKDAQPVFQQSGVLPLDDLEQVIEQNL